ncbi:hypothetical protein BU17DRAFT_69502 [Hysterangium stoloniferum]|nr:hypothetical protein BU17DRAFT_69502 [Hysterangium stoloniferum]
MVKGILKRYSLPGMNHNEDSDAPSCSPLPKRVSFDGAEPARVFQADEWDRSPAEVTLKLTYKDVVELRELNVSLIRTGPLAMERTPSRRPTRQRTTVSQSPTPIEANTSLVQQCRPSTTTQAVADKPSSRPSSPVFGVRAAPTSPSYQYQARSLPPLLEDASSLTSATSFLEHRTRGNGLSPSDTYLEYYSTSQSGSPPGLPARTPFLKGLASPTFSPSSPILLSSPLPSRPPSPKATSPSSSPVPLYRHPRARSRPSSLKNHGSTEAPAMPVILPSLTRRASVPDRLSFDKLELGTEHKAGRDSPSPTWKPMELAGTDTEPGSPNLIPNKDADANNALSSPPTPVITRKPGRSLMGWELKRSPNAYGKLGFGLVRKQGV